ncbi:MAG: phosphorylase [Flavobacteriales bacterium]|nr:phosphorylase [Flavobacteriales bacterium]|tara:strand:- start:2043 stop:2906 length:864 start_codon:yes stop_codon:yes gene_type:complete
MIHPSELVLNPDGSIYHLKLQPEQIGRKIIVAGDPGRIKSISAHFDRIDHIVENREFVTHTGIYKNQKVSAIATGIGTDNIDIVLNELDALVNIDLEKREIKNEQTELEIVRIGTCGSIQEDVPADEVVVSTHAFGLDGLLNFYAFEMNAEEQKIHSEIIQQTNWNKKMNVPYLVAGSSNLIQRIGKNYHHGITVTAPGFYAPQGRELRLKLRVPDVNEKLRAFKYKDFRIVNYEMETSALYGLSSLLGHQACTVCAVVANRYANSFSKDYKPVINQLIKEVLDNLV